MILNRRHRRRRRRRRRLLSVEMDLVTPRRCCYGSIRQMYVRKIATFRHTSSPSYCAATMMN